MALFQVENTKLNNHNGNDHETAHSRGVTSIEAEEAVASSLSDNRTLYMGATVETECNIQQYCT